MIYLASAASTKVDDSVNLFCETTKKYYANPNSNHKLGHEAKEKIDEYISKIAKLLNIYPEEIIYTSGVASALLLLIKNDFILNSVKWSLYSLNSYNSYENFDE